jgi:hypothetical protein
VPLFIPPPKYPEVELPVAEPLALLDDNVAPNVADVSVEKVTLLIVATGPSPPAKYPAVELDVADISSLFMLAPGVAARESVEKVNLSMVEVGPFPPQKYPAVPLPVAARAALATDNGALGKAEVVSVV